MPYSIDWEPQGVYCKFFGSVSIEDVNGMVSTVVNDARFGKLKYRVTDCLEVAQHNVVSGDIDNLVSMNNAYSFANARKHEAALATDPIVINLLRHWASTSPKDHQLCIFSNATDLRAWLNNPKNY